MHNDLKNIVEFYYEYVICNLKRDTYIITNNPCPALVEIYCIYIYI